MTDNASVPRKHDDDAEVVGIIAQHGNILSKETLQQVIESMPVGVYIMDDTGNIVYGNQAGRRIWEGIRYVGPGEFNEYKAWWYDSGKRISDDEWAGGRAIRNGEVSLDEEIRIQCFDGTEKIILNSALPLLDDNHNTVGAVIINRDISRQKKDEILLRHSEERSRRTLDHLMEGVQIIGYDWRYIYINNAAEVHNRRAVDELLGQKYMDAWPGIEDTHVFRVIQKCMVERLPQQLETQFTFPTGEVGWFDLRIQPVQEGVLILSVDNTARKQTEARLHQHQRLESLGYLAGGIAHDFNNLFGGIYGNIDLAVAESRELNVVRILERSMETIDRAKNLTRQLITFAKGGAPRREIGDLLTVVTDTINQIVSGNDIGLHIDADPELHRVSFDRDQIIQAVECVGRNAIEAMCGSGRLTVEVKNCNGDFPLFLTAEKNYVRISIRDSGHGISSEHIEKVFDPFFTTREPGRGLGLSTCYSILQRHDGGIEVKSAPTMTGTQVNMYLPTIPHTLQSVAAVGGSDTVKNGRLLIMDDDEVVRMATAAMLKRFGYEVTETADGESAFNLFRERFGTPNAYQAVLLDLTVPGGWGGAETIANIRRIDPSTPVFVASGYTTIPIMENPEQFGFTGCLHKPYQSSELRQLLEKYLIQPDAQS